MKNIETKTETQTTKKQSLIKNENKTQNKLLSIIKLFQIFYILEFSLLPLAISSVINIDNKDINTISYSNFIKNSNLGDIFFVENKIKNATDNFSDLGLKYSLNSAFIKMGQKGQLDLAPKTDFSILNSVYLQKEDKNLTYYKDYLIQFNVDDSVIPFYTFHTEGLRNSSFNVVLEDPKEIKDDNYNENKNNTNNNKLNNSNINPSTNFFNNNNNNKTKKPKDKQFDVSCNYTDNGLIYQSDLYSSELNFIKIESLEGLNFALTSDKKLIRLVFGAKAPNEPAFAQRNITEDLLFKGERNATRAAFVPIAQRKFDDFFLVNQFYETGTFIFALDYNSNVVAVYNITYWDYAGNYLVKLFAEVNLQEIFKTNNVVFNPNITNNNLNNTNNNNLNNNLPTITKFGTYKDSIVISTLEKGLVFLSQNPQSEKWESRSYTSVSYNNATHNLKIRDMSINKYTIYLICENFGMKIFSLKEFNFTEFEFPHPHLLRFDSNFPENMPSPFYGILVDNSIPSVNEFFIELKLQDYNELKPQINRVFISEAKSAKSLYYLQQQGRNGLVSFTNQLKLGVVFDRQNQRILLIDRGVPSFVETYTYKIDLQRINSNLKNNNNSNVNNNFNLNLNFNNNSSQLNNSNYNNNNNINNTNINILNNLFNTQSILNSEIFLFSTRTDKFQPGILLKLSNYQSLLLTEIKNSNVSFTCEFNQDGNFKINFIYKTVCRSEASWDSFDSYSSCPLFLTVPLQVQGGINLGMWIVIGVIALALVFLVLFVLCCFGMKKNRRFGSKGDEREEARYSQARSQTNDAKNEKNIHYYNNEVIEVQIIDDMK